MKSQSSLESRQFVRLWSLAFAAFFLVHSDVPQGVAAGIRGEPSSSEPRRPFRVMLDPGHGGNDAGATRRFGETEVRESDLVLEISRELRSELQSTGRVSVALTRDRDEAVPLLERAKLARTFEADLFLSIHINSSKDLRARGKEVYFQNQLPPDEDALFIASRENLGIEGPDPVLNPKLVERRPDRETDLRFILEDLRRNDRVRRASLFADELLLIWNQNGRRDQIGRRALRQAPFAVLVHAEMPAVLVELGYLSHPQEGETLARKDRRTQIVQDLRQAILRFSDQRAR